MLVTWKYRPRNTFIQSLDPRTRFILLGSVILTFSVLDIWDFRIIASLFLLSLTLFLMARIEWNDIRRPLKYISFLILFIIGLNALLSGRGGSSSVFDPNSPILFQISLIIPGTTWGWVVPVTIAKLWFAICQVLRIFSMTFMALPIPYTIDPNVYGTSFKRMGASDKFSFTMDLAFRFLPSFARDLTITVDAQRARGYEMDKLKGGFAEKLRKLAPLVIPVTMQSTVTGEEVIDAMDLRAFGTVPRTWLKELRYSTRDYFFIILAAAIFVVCAILRWGFGVGEFIIPDFFTNLFIS